MKNIINTNRLLILVLLFIGFSCQTPEYDTEYSSAFPLSGDWTVRVNDGATVSDPFFMKIYNTSFSKDSVWIDDSALNFFKAKAKVDMKNLTFSGTDAPNEYDVNVVSFANSKLIGKDSIYFEATVTDSIGSVSYTYSGHRKVSYEEYNTPQ